MVLAPIIRSMSHFEIMMLSILCAYCPLVHLLLYLVLGRVPTSFFCMRICNCPLVERTLILSPLNCLAILFKKSTQTIDVWVYSRLSILFHWSMCFSSCHTMPTFMPDNTHSVLTAVAVQLVLKLGSVSPPTLFFFKIIWLFWVPCCSIWILFLLIFFKGSWGTSLVVQSIRLHTPNAGGPGSIPGQGTRCPHAATKKSTCCN